MEPRFNRIDRLTRSLADSAKIVEILSPRGERLHRAIAPSCRRALRKITDEGIVNLSGRGMLVVSVARQLGSGNSFARLLCCPAQPSGAGERRLGSVKLISDHVGLLVDDGIDVRAIARRRPRRSGPHRRQTL